MSHTAFVPISFTSAPMRNDGRIPASTKISDSMDAVVVFPCVPAMARQSRVAQMAASISERGTTRAPAAAATRISTFSSGTAGEYVTASTSVTFSERCPTATAMPCERRRSATAESFRSEPVTVWPMARNTRAIALMPAPPMPTTWTRCGTVRSSASLRATP